MGRLEGKVAAITGGASGFGAATAGRFVEEGARVVLGDIQQEACREVAGVLGASALAISCDVTREDEVAHLVDQAVEKWGRLDIMFNNAGIVGAVGPVATTPAEEWRITLDILLTGVFYGCKHAARVMQPRGRGSIINTSSEAGITGGRGPHAYAAAKHGVIGLTKNVAAELAQFGIRCNSICPTAMATAMVAGLWGDHRDLAAARERLAETSPLKGRAGSAEDVANAALWLASDESGHTTGHALTTDAGMTTGAGNTPPFPEYQPLVREAGKTGLE